MCSSSLLTADRSVIGSHNVWTLSDFFYRFLLSFAGMHFYHVEKVVSFFFLRILFLSNETYSIKFNLKTKYKKKFHK